MTIGDRLKVLEEKLGDSANKLGLRAGLGNGSVPRWASQPITFNNPQVNQFIEFYNINIDWWQTGQGEVFTAKPDAAVKIELYERLVALAVESKEDARSEANKWEEEAKRLSHLLELALKSIQPSEGT
jgi:hypothetical protein